MSSQSRPKPEIQQALLKVIKTLTEMPAQVVFYGSALLAIAATGGVALPGFLGAFATSVGVNVLANMLERVAKGDEVPEDEIRKTVEDVIHDSGIEKLVTSNEFQRAIAHVFRQFDLLKYAVQKGEFTIVAILTDQFAQHKVILDELQSELSIVRGQMETLATREQSAEILKLVEHVAKHLEVQLPSSIEIGNDNSRSSTDTGLLVSEDQQSRLALVMCPSNKIRIVEKWLMGLFKQIRVEVQYYGYDARSKQDLQATIDYSQLVFWTFDRQPLHLEWKHKEGFKLLQERRKHFVLLIEDCELPSQFTVFHKVDLSDSHERRSKLVLLGNRLLAPLPEVKTSDFFIQTIMEELMIGKSEYSKKMPSMEKSGPNLFAAMYITAQVQEYEELLAHTRYLYQSLPRTSFQNRESVTDIRKTLKEVLSQTNRIQVLVDLGLQVSSDHELGFASQLSCKEIQRMVQDEMISAVERHLGSSGTPPGLSLQMRVLIQSMSELRDQFTSIRDSLRSVQMISK